MSDIKGQLIKDSYNYVLQSDITTGVVYRIGGAVPTNPIFQSGLTINQSFTFSDGSEQNGYVLTSDGSGNATWRPVSGATPSSGVTSITVGTGLSANSSTGAVTIVFTGSTSATGDYLPLSGGTVTGNTTFTSGLTVNYIDFDTTPNVPSPTGGTLFFDSVENALAYKPITPNNDVTIQIGQEMVMKVYNGLGTTILNGQAVHITGSTSGYPSVCLAIATGGSNEHFQVSGIATHDILPGTFGFITYFGFLHDVNLTAFTVGDQVYLSQSTPGGLADKTGLYYTGRTCEIGHVIDNSVNGVLQVTIINELQNTTITSLENNVITAGNTSTGVFEFSGLTIDTPSGTTFSVAPVKGWIIDNTTNTLNPSIIPIVFNGQSNIHSTYYSSDTETYILLTSGLTITQQTTFPTPQQRRQNIYLGKFGHGTRQFLINAFSEPDLVISPLSQVRDMFSPIKLINDGVYPSANGANLSFNTSAGYLWGLGINFINSTLNPTRFTVNGRSPATFQYRTQTGGTASNTTSVDPLNYDLNGAVTPITGTKATNQRIYLLQNGQIRMQYGQNVYNQLSAAIAAVQTESFVTFPNFRDNAILIGILSILSTCTNLSDNTKAQFFYTSKFGESVGAAGGASTTTLQQAYNNSSQPEIVINSTLDGLTIQNGTGNSDNTTNLLEGQNAAGVTTSFMRADGLLSGSSVSSPSFTANTNGILVGSTPSLYTTTAKTITTGSNTIYSTSKTLYNSIFIDYSLSGSTGKRAGTIVGIWDGTNVDYNETSTVDIGTTTDVVLSLATNTNIDLVATVSSSTWLIKTIIKSI